MAYFVLTLFFAVIWIAAFLFRPDLRRPLLLVSLAIAPLGPVSEFWFLSDYWSRETLTGTVIGIDDALFGFFVGGASFALYKIVFCACLYKPAQALRLPYIPVYAALITMLSLLLLTDGLGINSIFSSSLAMWITAAVIWRQRRDLIGASLISGMLSMLLFGGGYIALEYLFPGTLEHWCLRCNPTHLRVLGINIEELAWDFSWGLVGGVIYEATTGRFIHLRIPAIADRDSD